MGHKGIARRHLLAWGGMMVTTLGSLQACGGGDPPAADHGGPVGGGSGEPLDTVRRQAVLAEVASTVESLRTGALRFDASALVARLNTMPEIAAAGISDRMQNVWARFTDGRALVVPNSLDPLPVTTGQARPDPLGRRRERAAGASASALPALLTEQQYRQLDLLGRVPLDSGPQANHLFAGFVGPDTLPDLEQMAYALGLVPPDPVMSNPPGWSTSIEGLRAAGGDGVLLLNGVAAEAPDGSGTTVAICTTLPADARADSDYADDLLWARLVYAVSPVGDGEGWSFRAHLAFTPLFARHYGWRFPTASVAILNLCGGNPLWAWGSVLESAGLRNVLTWSAPVPVQTAVAFADDLMQLLLATNRFGGGAGRYGITLPPKLRTHGIGATAEFLAHAASAQTGGLPLGYLGSRLPGELVQTLLPMIDHVQIRENTREAELVGMFGARRDAAVNAKQFDGRSGVVFGATKGEHGRNLIASDTGRALVASAADVPLQEAPDRLPVRDWSKGNIITLDIASLGPGGGYLQVRNGGRVSNAVPITYWRIPLTVTLDVDGGLQQRCTLTLHLRADVSGHRLKPDDRPHDVRPTVLLVSMFESSASYEASGEVSRSVDGTTSTITWSGGSTAENASPQEFVVGCIGSLDMATRRCPMNVVAGNGSHDEHEVVQRDGKTVLDETRRRTINAIVTDLAQAPMQFEFDERWTLQAGQHTGAATRIDVLGSRAVTHRVTWEQVTPMFPPVDDFGGT